MRKIKGKTKTKRRGIPNCIKAKTLERRASLFFTTVRLIDCSEWDALLECGGMKICNMCLPVYAQNISEAKYAVIISDFLQAELESFGLKVGRPIPNKIGGYTYLICR